MSRPCRQARRARAGGKLARAEALGKKGLSELRGDRLDLGVVVEHLVAQLAGDQRARHKGLGACYLAATRAHIASRKRTVAETVS